MTAITGSKRLRLRTLLMIAAITGPGMVMPWETSAADGSWIDARPISEFTISALETAGRWFGAGWSDGYHSCERSPICLSADLPPQSQHRYRPWSRTPGGNIAQPSYNFDAIHPNEFGCETGCCETGCAMPGCVGGCVSDSTAPVYLDTNGQPVSGQRAPGHPSSNPAIANRPEKPQASQNSQMVATVDSQRLSSSNGLTTRTEDAQASSAWPANSQAAAASASQPIASPFSSAVQAKAASYESDPANSAPPPATLPRGILAYHSAASSAAKRPQLWDAGIYTQQTSRGQTSDVQVGRPQRPSAPAQPTQAAAYQRATENQPVARPGYQQPPATTQQPVGPMQQPLSRRTGQRRARIASASIRPTVAQPGGSAQLGVPTPAAQPTQPNFDRDPGASYYLAYPTGHPTYENPYVR